MTQLRYLITFPSVGTSLTTSNTGSPAPQQITKTSSATTIKSQNTNPPFTGALYAEQLAVSGESGTIRCPFNVTTNLTGAVNFYYYNGGAPGSSETIAAVSNVGGSQILKILHSNTNKMIIQASGGTTLAAWAASATSSPESLPAGWVRIEVLMVVGASTSTGDVKVNFYSLNSGTPTNATQFHSSTANLGTTALSYFDVGRVLTPATTGTFDYYAVATNDGATTEIGTYTPGGNAPPTGSAGSTQTVAVNTLVTLAGSATDSDGTIASTVWSQTSGPTQTLSSNTILGPTFTPTVPGVCVFNLVITDNLGATANYNVTINITSTSARPSSTVSNAGSFTNVGGAASIEAALADESDTTLMQSVAGPNGAVIIFAVTPLGTGSITVGYRAKQDISSPVVTRLSELLQGPSNTVIASHSDNLTTTLTDYSWAPGGTAEATITDRNALRVRITDTQN